MVYAEIDWNICKICDPCSAQYLCKVRAIVKFDSDEPAIVDVARCNGCGICVSACEFSAINMYFPSGVVTSETLIE
jgi:Fe-S-cluster-containing hydrogenase component 2